MYRYAQIDETGLCVSVSQLSGEVISDHMLPLDPDDDVRPGYIWDGEKWTRPEPPPPPPDPLALLEEENALLALELAQTKIRLDQAEQEQAELLLELVSRGVI